MRYLCWLWYWFSCWNCSKWSSFGPKPLRYLHLHRKLNKMKYFIFFIWSYCGLTWFPIWYIYVDFDNNTLDHIVFIMIQSWIKNLDRKKWHLYIFIDDRTKWNVIFIWSYVWFNMCLIWHIYVDLDIEFLEDIVFRTIQFWIKNLESCISTDDMKGFFFVSGL